MEKPIIVDDWQNGITEDLTSGLNLVKNASVYNIKGTIIPSFLSTTLFPTGPATTFTSNAATSISTLGGVFGTANTTMVAVTLTTTGTLPAGLSLNTTYFIIKVTSNTFKLATSVVNANAGTFVTISGTGIGTHTITPMLIGGINSIIETPLNQTFILDIQGNLWCLDSGGTSIYLVFAPTTDSYSHTAQGGSTGQGMNIYTNSDYSKTQLFIFRDTQIDLFNCTTASNTQSPVSSSAWLYNFTATYSGSTVTGPVITAINALGAKHFCFYNPGSNSLYFCNASYVGSFFEVGVFNPWPDGIGAGTFSFQAQALVLPRTDYATSIEVLGLKILVGGYLSSYIYFWDGSALFPSTAVQCGELGIYFLKNINGNVFILAGDKGNIYSTQGYYVQFVKRVPEFLTGGIVNWSAIGSDFGHLLFSFYSAGSYNGLWRLTPEGVLSLDNTASTGPGAAGAILVHFDKIYYGGAIGGGTGGYNGFDVVGTTIRQTQYNSSVMSGLYMIGTKTKPEKISQAEIQISSPTGTDTIRVSYRRDTTSGFTVWATFTMNNTDTSFTDDSNGLINIENIQFLIEFGGAVELLVMRLQP